MKKYNSPLTTSLSFVFRNIVVTAIFVMFASSQANAQSKKGEFINAKIGFGVTVPSNNVDVSGTGFFAQVEYVWAPKTWLSLRPYTGVIFADTNQDDLDPSLRGFEVKTNAWMLGGKGRIQAPIPYVAPYLELGLGASVGSFVTNTPQTTKDITGVLLHIPFTIGLGLGKNNRTDLEFAYYFTPQAKQFSGAFAFGLSFPINEKRKNTK